MATSVQARLQRFDHATVPSIDLLEHLDFYEMFFGAELPERKAKGMPPMVNFSIARRKSGRASIFFINVGGHTGFGLFLQEEYPPPPLRLLEGPRYGFGIVGNGLDHAVSVLAGNGVEFMGPVKHDERHPFSESVYFKDPSDNSLELSVWRDREFANRKLAGGKGLIPVSGLSHCAFDVTDLELAGDFYVAGLGIEPLFRGTTPDGLPCIVLQIGSRQVVTLQQVDEMSERSVKKYLSDCHAAFNLPHEEWEGVEREMGARNVEMLPDYPAMDGSREPYHNVYVVDPFGNNVQVTGTDGKGRH